MYRLRNADPQPGAAYRIISMIIASGSGSRLMVFYPRATSRIIIRTKPKEKATVPQLV